jgi:hypothetical protein
MYQQLANEQALAEHCYVGQLNLYLDSASGLGARYGVCKRDCLAKEPQLERELRRREEKQGASNEYYSPIYTNICLTACRNNFYFTYKRLGRYFSSEEDRGFMVESTLRQLN